MDTFRCCFSIMLVFVGGIMAVIGFVFVALALSGGSIPIRHSGNVMPLDIAEHSRDPARFWRTLASFGGLPVRLGATAAPYGWRRLTHG